MIQQLEISMVAKETVAFLTGGLFYYAELLQFSQSSVDSGVCEPGFFF